MSAEDDDLRWIKSELARLSSDAKDSDNLGVRFIDLLAAGYDDRIAAERVAKDFARRNWKQRLLTVLRCGAVPDSRDALCSAFVDALSARRELTRQQARVVNVFRVVRFSEDGRTEVILPSSASYRRAQVMMMVLSVPLMVAAWLVWEIFSTNLVGIAISWTLGSLLGWIGRAIYDSAWGRARVAQVLASRYRWLVLRPAD